MAVIALTYFLLAKAGLALAIGTKQVTAVWPPTGFALAVALICGRRVWPGVALGAFLANLTTAEPVLTALGIAAGNTLEALAASSLLRAGRFRADLRRKEDVASLLLCGGVAGPLISATVGVASLRLGGVIGSFSASTWSTWLLGDMTGALIFAPPILVLAPYLGRLRPAVKYRRLVEAALTLLALTAVAAVIFGAGPPARPYLLFPLLFAATLRLGQPGAVAAVVLVSVAAVWQTALGHGVFGAGASDTGLLGAQVFVAVLALTSLLIAAVVSERVHAEVELELSERIGSELRAAERLSRELLEAAPDAMVIVDSEGQITLVNAQTTALLGYSRDELIGRPVELLIPTSVAAGHANHRQAYRASPAVRPMGAGLQLSARHKDGHEIPVEISLSPLHTDGGHLVLASIRDITERRALERQLRYLADHDSLTGLRNRRGLEDALSAHAAAGGEDGALIVLDLDHLKSVNDTLGHGVGDELIVAVANVLRKRVRGTDTVARFGGDEFAILLPHADEPAARDLAARLVTEIREHTVVFGEGVQHRASASVGIAMLAAATAGEIDALSAADQAMYDAKQGGRDQVAVYVPGQIQLAFATSG
jgi:diguanylate cyclase (GGDEF)-like protein/PAS domain S-box-containing protein